MSVNYKAILAFGQKFTKEERDAMLEACGYAYEDDFIPIDAYCGDTDYIFGIEIVWCNPGQCFAFNNLTFDNFVPTSTIKRIKEKLTKMGVDAHFLSCYLINQVI